MAANGSGGRTSGATVNEPEVPAVLSGFVADTSDFEVSHRGRTGLAIPDLVPALNRQLRENSGSYWFNGMKSQDVTFKKHVTNWVATHALPEGAISVTYSTRKDLGGDKIARGVIVRIEDDDLRAKVAEKMAASA